MPLLFIASIMLTLTRPTLTLLRALMHTHSVPLTRALLIIRVMPSYLATATLTRLVVLILVALLRDMSSPSLED